MTQASPTPLQTVIAEFQNISPEIGSVFIFKKDGEAIANNEVTTEEEIKKLTNTFNDIVDTAQVIGGIQNLTIQGADSQISINSINDLYLTTTSSRAADPKVLKALTHVLVPTIVKLVEQSAPELSEKEETENSPLDQPINETVQVETTQTVEEPSQDQPVSEPATTLSSEPVLPQAPVTQFMVERIGGLLVAPDIVRVDGDVIKKWSNLYGNKLITQVYIETLEGKAVICRFKPMKEAHYNPTRGIIQIPEKVLQALQTSNGKLVMAKPVAK